MFQEPWLTLWMLIALGFLVGFALGMIVPTWLGDRRRHQEAMRRWSNLRVRP